MGKIWHFSVKILTTFVNVLWFPLKPKFQTGLGWESCELRFPNFLTILAVSSYIHLKAVTIFIPLKKPEEKCDPTWVNEADLVSGPNCDFAVNVFYRNQESFRHKKSFWYHFPFQRYKKTRFMCKNFKNLKTPCFKQFKVSFCKQVNEANRQHSM